LRVNKAYENLATSIKYQWLSDEKIRDNSLITGQSEVIFYQTDIGQQQIDLGLQSTKHPKTP
jgi:hypothetical protein